MLKKYRWLLKDQGTFRRRVFMTNLRASSFARFFLFFPDMIHFLSFIWRCWMCSYVLFRWLKGARLHAFHFAFCSPQPFFFTQLQCGFGRRGFALVLGSIVVCMAVVLFRSLFHGLVTQRLSKHIIALISCPGNTTYWPMRFWACPQSSVKICE